MPLRKLAHYVQDNCGDRHRIEHLALLKLSTLPRWRNGKNPNINVFLATS